MELNPQIKQENFDEGEMLIDAQPRMSQNNLKRTNDVGNENINYTKRPCNYTAMDLHNLEQTLLQKRHVRGDVPTIYNPPFYELQKPRPEHGDKVVARCCSCNVLLRGSKSITSNFIKHMKNSHPKVYLLYQRIKTLKSTNRKLESPQNNKYTKTEHGQGAYELPLMTTLTMEASSNGASCDAEQVSENTEFSATLSNYSNEEDIVEADVSTAESPYDAMHQHQSQQQQQHHHHTSHGNDGTDLSFQMLNAMSSLLDEKLKVFITKDELNEVKRAMAATANETATVTNTNKGVNASPVVTKLQEQVVKLETECNELRSAMKQLQQSKRQMQLNLQTIDRKLNHCKLIIKNVKIENNEQPQGIVEKLLQEQLNLSNIAINTVEIVTKKNKKTTNNIHNLYVELKDEQDASAILKNCYKLKKSGIRIEQQQMPFLRKQQCKLLVLRKEILKRKSNVKTCLRDGELIVEGIKFYWDDVECLCLSSYNVKDLNAISCLNRLANSDFNEFINFLKHYDVRVAK